MDMDMGMGMYKQGQQRVYAGMRWRPVVHVRCRPCSHPEGSGATFECQRRDWTRKEPAGLRLVRALTMGRRLAYSEMR